MNVKWDEKAKLISNARIFSRMRNTTWNIIIDKLFIGDKAYIVTFRNIDPLWTIDLSEPTNPRIIGELKIPGVSTYIHPVGDTHLLTIGIAGDDDGLDWGVTQVSFFDVSDFSNPILESSLKLNPAPNGENGWSYSHSEATYEHKAFQYWESDGLLAIPMSTNRWYQDTIEEDGKMYYYHGYEYISKLMLINATPGKSLGIYSEKYQCKKDGVSLMELNLPTDY